MIDYLNDGQVARITLNRPDAGNRLTYRMMTDFIAALEDATRSGATVLLLASAGADFTLGRDQKEKVDISRRENLSLILKANDLLRKFSGVAVSLIKGVPWVSVPDWRCTARLRWRKKARFSVSTRSSTVWRR